MPFCPEKDRPKGTREKVLEKQSYLPYIRKSVEKYMGAMRNSRCSKTKQKQKQSKKENKREEKSKGEKKRKEKRKVSQAEYLPS